MYLSKVTFKDPRNAWRELSHEYSLHQRIWALMSKAEEQKRDFLYRVVTGDLPTIYIQSVQLPHEDDSLFYTQTKVYDPRLMPDMQLQFTVRVNPIISVGHEKDKRSKRHDVVMHKKHSLRLEGQPMPTMDQLVQSAVGEWIQSRQERCGFVLDPLSLTYSEYTQREFYKRKASKKISLSTVDISGVLKIKDSKSFLETLHTGLGAAKGFGCGLMLIKIP
jgi:CRISPR system Cascade subunit CasE